MSSEFLGAIEAATGPGARPHPGAPADLGAAYSSELTLTLRPSLRRRLGRPDRPDRGTAWLRMTGGHWVRLRRAG